MLAIAANTVREFARKRPREVALAEEPPATIPDLDPERAAREAALERAIGRLDEDERVLFLLHSAEGVGLEELATERKTTAAAMKSRVHRVRAKVRCLALAEIERGGGEE